MVTFTYDTTLRDQNFSGEKIVVSVKDLNGNLSQSVTYMKSRGDATFNGNPDGYTLYLSYIQKQDNSFTSFDYSYFQNNKFDYDHPVDSSYAGYISLHPLNAVFDVRSTTNFQYEKVNRRLGSNGFAEELRTISRSDQINNSNYNQINYSYTGDYTGYNSSSPYNNPSTYDYTSTQSIQSTSPTGGLTTTTSFNNLGQVTSISTLSSNGERKIVSNTAFDSVYKSMPTEIVSKGFSSNSNTAAYQYFSSKQYTDWGGIQNEVKPIDASIYNYSKYNYTISYTYDPTSYLLKSKSWYQSDYSPLLSEQYDYYSNGRIKSFKNAKGEIINYCYDVMDNAGQLNSNCMDQNVNLTGKVVKVKVTQNLGNGQTSINETLFNATTNYSYPSESKSYFTTKNSSGLDVTHIIQKTFAYDMGKGLLESETDSNGKITSYQYDELGRLTRISYPSFENTNGIVYDVADELSHTNSFIPSDADPVNAGVSALRVSSKRIYTQKPNNVTTQLSAQNDYYDGLGFLRYSQVSNNGVSQVTQYRPDDLSRVVYSIDPMSNTTAVSYDPWGSQKEVTDSYGNLYVSNRDVSSQNRENYFVAAEDVQAYRINPDQDALKSSYVRQRFDQWGHLLKSSVYSIWPRTSESKEIAEEYTYDIVGNLKTYTKPYRQNSGKTTLRYGYDPLNQLLSVDTIGTATQYTYDENGKITNMTVQSTNEAPKNINSKTYNEIGRLNTKTDPAFNQEHYSYNNLGLVQQINDRNGTQFNYQYDNQNRLTISTAVKLGSVTQEYKSIIGSNGILNDRIENYINGIMSVSLTSQMDYLKRVTSVQIQRLDSTYDSSLGISYDKNNRISQYSSSGGASSTFYTQYKYDRTRLDKVQINGLNTVNNTDEANVKYTYYPNGKVKSISYPPLGDGSVLKTEFVYTHLKQNSSVINKKGMNVISSYSYKYDDGGNITDVYETIGNQATKHFSYQYDHLDRLTVVVRPDGSAAKYKYDTRGNRLSVDDTGNPPISLENTSYQYDLFNRLISNTKGTVTTSFDYSPDGLRYRKTNGSSIKQYRYNLDQEVISEVNENNVVTANYVRGDRLLVKKDTTLNKDYYYLYNGHGDVVQIVDTNGNVVNSYTYDEWGNITQQTEQIENEFKYSGEIFDKDTGLYYLRARYYDPSMGRFLNEDTYEGQIDDPLSQNLYTYVHNNPLTNVDPTGHWCTSSNGKWAHAGACNDASSTWSPDWQHVGDAPISNGKKASWLLSKFDLEAEDKYVLWIQGDNQVYLNSSNEDRGQMRQLALESYMDYQIKNGFPDFQAGLAYDFSALSDTNQALIMGMLNRTTLWDIKTGAVDKINYNINGSSVSAYQDPNTGLYWARDTEGHGGSAYKVFEKRGNELRWVADSDEYGNYINKHKGPKGLRIKIK